MEDGPMGSLDDLGAAIAKVAEGVNGSTVGVGERGGGESGSAFAKGKVLTNANNLHGHEVHVYFLDGREADGKVLGVDGDGDLAVIGVETGETAPFAWGDASSLGIGAPVIAIGNPSGQGLRVTAGFVSGIDRSFRGPRGRRVAGAVEHTAPLMPGSSGGPIVDTEGRLLGINPNRVGRGLYQAIAADPALKSKVDALGRGEQPQRRRLGVGLAPAHVARHLQRAVGLPERDGLLVREVEDGSPAEKAGIAEGDLIVEAGGKVVTSADDLFDALAAWTDGTLAVKIVRGSEERSVNVSA